MIVDMHCHILTEEMIRLMQGVSRTYAPFLTTTELTLAHPSLAFRNVSADAPAPKRMPYIRKPVFSRGGDGWNIIVVALDWNRPTE